MICDEARWFSCGYYDGGLRRRKLVNLSISYIHPSLSKQLYIKCERSRRHATESFFSSKIDTKMPTRTKSVEMNQIVTNSEIHLHHFLCESRDFKIGRSSRLRCSLKKVQTFMRLLTTFDQLKAMYGCWHHLPITARL